MKIDLQLASRSSIPEVLEMMRDFYAIDGYPFHMELTRANLHGFLKEAQSGRIWMFLFDGKVVGYAVLTFIFSFEHGGKMAFLDEFYVREPYRHLGIGKWSLGYIEKWAFEMGINRIHLELEPHNTMAKALYLKQGFTDSGRSLFNKKIKNTLIEASHINSIDT